MRGEEGEEEEEEGKGIGTSNKFFGGSLFFFFFFSIFFIIKVKLTLEMEGKVGSRPFFFSRPVSGGDLATPMLSI